MTVKPRTNYLLDVIILALLVIVLLSGLLLWQVYPAGGARHRGAHDAADSAQALLGIERAEMRSLHDWAGLLMGALVGLHLLFHWKWIGCQTRRLLGRPARSQRACQDERGRT